MTVPSDADAPLDISVEVRPADEQTGALSKILQQSSQPRQHEMALVRGKTVLLLETDLYVNVGGGQTSYRKLIEASPSNMYYYFSVSESADAKRPNNTKVIKFDRFYHADLSGLPSEMYHFYTEYMDCWQIAASVQAALGPCQFDVVDTPDYHRYGLFIRGALAAHDIKVGAVALALHGTISSALSDQWPRSSAPPRLLAELRLREHLQYRVADVRYALSRFYGDEWERATALAARPIDPLRLVGEFHPTAAEGTKPVDLCFVGRRERCKGPDLAVDLAWALPQGSFGQLRLIGSEVVNNEVYSSGAVVNRMGLLRNIAIDQTPKMLPQQLELLFRQRNIIILPSRRDTFNLVALEALRFGCPVFISKRAGASRWLLDNYPELSHLVIDIDCSRTGAVAIRETLLNYDEVRQQIVDVLTARPPLTTRDDVRDMFEPIGRPDVSARASIQDIQLRFDNFNRPRPNDQVGPRARVKAMLSRRVSIGAKRMMRSTAANFQKMAKPPSLQSYAKTAFERQAVQRNWLHGSAPTYIRSLREIEGTRSRLLGLGERTKLDVAAKLKAVSAELPSMRVGRVAIFRDMVRLERKRGADLTAATYCLRIMRWLDRDQFGDLDFVVSTLRNNGLPAEAEAADAMYRDPATAFQRITAILKAQAEGHRSKPDLPLEILDDRRGSEAPTVSVISSLYNAESKLRTLLDNMRIQSLASAGRLEIVLVDSGSPTREYEVFKAFADTHDLPIVYARSKDRESIQKAWNRGIKLARAPYLSFLGCDEGLHPDCLSILSEALDGRPDVDWAMADSIVTDVDRQGVFAGDIMPYDREGYDWTKVFLDTTYLSWVGGLYRKSIHDRFGYYDDGFRAAGDTEFKWRVLSGIKTMHVPRMLGIFNNYPEERATQSPRAELEDLRAWYLHRTPAGIAQTFDRHPVEIAEGLVRSALTYRKAYCRHWSTDFDIAHAVATYLVKRGENPGFASRALKSTTGLLRAAQAFDTVDFRQTALDRQIWALRTLYDLRRKEQSDQLDLGLSMRPHYAVFNDNRHEQHWWSWSV